MAKYTSGRNLLKNPPTEYIVKNRVDGNGAKYGEFFAIPYVKGTMNKITACLKVRYTAPEPVSVRFNFRDADNVLTSRYGLQAVARDGELGYYTVNVPDSAVTVGVGLGVASSNALNQNDVPVEIIEWAIFGGDTHYPYNPAPEDISNPSEITGGGCKITILSQDEVTI